MFFLLLVVLLFGFECSAKQLPPGFPRCYLDDPKLNECLLNTSIVLKPDIRKGIKEIGLPSYDPLVISFEVTEDSNLLSYTGAARNFTLRGMKNYDITELRYDPKTMTFKGKIGFEPLSVNTLYVVNGRMLFIPIQGNGTLQFTMGPINGTFEITGEKRTHKNLDHYYPTDVKVRLTIDDASINFSGLFDGNKVQEILTNYLLNQNSKLLSTAFTPFYEKISEQYIMRYLKWLTKTYPYYELFPYSKSDRR